MSDEKKQNMLISIHTAIQNYPKFSFFPFKMSLMAYLICNIIWKLVLLMAIAARRIVKKGH